MDWVAIAPATASTAGTAEPTARNRLATATPYAVRPDVCTPRATIENVMAGDPIPCPGVREDGAAPAAEWRP
ncbi:hypothetical protein GCM10022220_45700 [Actinocatenispora rupis]|uniref:Uncharacterized protein n=1 Tax=Actinocatenispora rupis TaxID=519421 RepID=A0A8J3JDL8_9ACTN|nr:hypothetical protein Aru02nite_56730 [Actinocatenispora rupis]